MVPTLTTVARLMPVANGMPLAAIGAREEVPPCCVTGSQRLRLLPSCRLGGTVMKPQIAVVGL